MSYENIPKNEEETAVLTEVSKSVPIDIANFPPTPKVVDFYYEVAAGTILGSKPVSVLGNGTSTQAGFDATAAQVVSVVSDSALDKGTRAGAKTLKLVGISIDFQELTQEFILNGTNPTLSTGLFYRVNSAEVLTAGSSGNNIGTITVTQTTSLLVLATIEPTVNSSMEGVYTVPAGKQLVITEVSAQALLARRPISASVFITIAPNTGAARYSSYLTSPLTALPAGTDIKLVGASNLQGILS